MKNLTIVFLIYTIAFGITSCSKTEIKNRGYVTKFSDFSQIKVGSSTKNDVIQSLGSPTTTSIYGDETWFYLGKEESKETFFRPETKSYDAYEITFDKAGVVSALNKKDKTALKEMEAEEDYTKTSGNEITVWQQLFGNLGKFNPASRQNRISGASNPTGRGY